MYLGREEKEKNCSLGGGGGRRRTIMDRERSRRRLLGEVEDNSCNLRGGEQR